MTELEQFVKNAYITGVLSFNIKDIETYSDVIVEEGVPDWDIPHEKRLGYITVNGLYQPAMSVVDSRTLYHEYHGVIGLCRVVDNKLLITCEDPTVYPHVSLIDDDLEDIILHVLNEDYVRFSNLVDYDAMADFYLRIMDEYPNDGYKVVKKLFDIMLCEKTHGAFYIPFNIFRENHNHLLSTDYIASELSDIFNNHQCIYDVDEYLMNWFNPLNKLYHQLFATKNKYIGAVDILVSFIVTKTIGAGFDEFEMSGDYPEEIPETSIYYNIKKILDAFEVIVENNS